MIEVIEAAMLAACSESMCSDVLAPKLDARANNWRVVGYLTAANALFGAQALGIGVRVYYGFVAVSTLDPNEFVAVVRGTELAIEWMENIEGFLVPSEFNGQVEHGFSSIYSSMRLETFNKPSNVAASGIAALLPAGARITCIGHSLGGALATYLMARLAWIAKASSTPFQVFGEIFASPRPGDSHFVNYVDQLVGSANYRAYAYIRDVVPHVPPALPFGLGFQSLPNTVWITPLKADAKIQNNPACNHHVLSYAAMIDAEHTAQLNLTPAACVIA